ncbi:MAG: MOSC domain-containing protein, partial [Vicinamibacterales bacterium]
HAEPHDCTEVAQRQDARHNQVVPTIASVNTSLGGVPKTSVFEAFLSDEGVSGDAHADTSHHGGPDRAVVVYSLEIIRALQHEGHPIAPGTTGENLTVSGLDWVSVTPGTRLRAGGALLEVTKYTTPCTKIGGSFLDRAFIRIGQQQHPGWSRVCARVIEPGLVRPGDHVEVLTTE